MACFFNQFAHEHRGGRHGFSTGSFFAATVVSHHVAAPGTGALRERPLLRSFKWILKTRLGTFFAERNLDCSTGRGDCLADSRSYHMELHGKNPAGGKIAALPPVALRSEDPRDRRRFAEHRPAISDL
jgi:hypothetical protein